ncbi:hypothetical protein E2C01_027251 [Portunus trituberculatus]|uniref:Uncharacterized protein n=1 Tax=Portunus trituberculatus TaxID=210409 RepID=A0A5B7EN88_PORTR|nr:hypothetical protein [Portunus trituberculatus]
MDDKHSAPPDPPPDDGPTLQTTTLLGLFTPLTTCMSVAEDPPTFALGLTAFYHCHQYHVCVYNTSYLHNIRHPAALHTTSPTEQS